MYRKLLQARRVFPFAVRGAESTGLQRRARRATTAAAAGSAYGGGIESAWRARHHHSSSNAAPAAAVATLAFLTAAWDDSSACDGDGETIVWVDAHGKKVIETTCIES